MERLYAGRPAKPSGQLIFDARAGLRVNSASGGPGSELVGYPLAGRLGGNAGEVDLAAGDLDEEEDMETLEPVIGNRL